MVTASNGCVSVVGKLPLSYNTPGGAGPSSGGSTQSASSLDFRLSLSTNVSNADFQLGYSMTGTLERGSRREGRMDMTHYAMIKRKGY